MFSRLRTSTSQNKRHRRANQTTQETMAAKQHGQFWKNAIKPRDIFKTTPNLTAKEMTGDKGLSCMHWLQHTWTRGLKDRRFH